MKIADVRSDREGAPSLSSVSNARYPVSRDTPDAVQRRCGALVAQAKNTTGMPDNVKEGMQRSFQSDFSNVTVHPSSSKAPALGAQAFTQGHEIHFAPGQFRPDTTSGRALLGHELAHVVQQREGRVSPTCEVSGMPVNDNPGLEAEADALGKRASGSV
ncbi:eCIS core domain-containing protein [Desulfoluna spongiiphila]|uniref:eCIS core domain-containing protein n=1 Tax=Desulfoluna spongiiphila TaxID=419481 RepID=A0A1G5DIC9_9BACT|nr:DUF4157 domain-containing protein [Desulfoluna spongiiphila]SCY14493.1 protein of unknown function [Desulfoluna spongiiphila]VVS95113.1 consensus disorder prediction [Desulfoluna spongiiphila]